LLGQGKEQGNIGAKQIFAAIYRPPKSKVIFQLIFQLILKKIISEIIIILGFYFDQKLI
jgi:hypothetical protein